MKNTTALTRATVALFAAGCLPVLSFSSQAADDAGYTENGWSAGMSIGKSSANIDSAAIRTALENNGFAVTSIDKDSRNEGYKVYLGYQFGRYIGLEGGYFDLGDFRFMADTVPVTNYGGYTKLKGWNLDLVGTLPLTARLSAFARLGVTRNESETRFSSNGLINTARYSDDYSKHKYGLGLQYDISAAFTLRLEAERYRMDDLVGNDGDIDLYSLGLVYRFGENQLR
ncbi:outer membrane beta-barrel protein [Rheinheimera sp. NSM]|uniref:outer membrane beta-barrel protein n=1 Tax=Rheinheimera sp. NSM TaxID=3457884 RepID=UPI0040356CFD